MIPGLAGIMGGRRRQIITNALYDTWVALVDATGGTYETDSKSIALALSNQLLAASYFSHIRWLAPLLGANLAAARCPLVDDPTHGGPWGAMTVISGFVDADFDQAVGLRNTGTKKMSSKFPPQNDGGDQRGGLGYWELDFPNTSNEVMGSFSNSNNERYVIDLRATRKFFSWGNSGNAANVNTTAGNHHYYGQRTSATNRELYEDGALIATNTANDTATGVGDRDVYVASSNENPAIGATTLCGVAYRTYGNMTAGDVAALHTLLQNYLITPTGR